MSGTACTVLLTCAGRRAALIDAFRAALRALGVEGRLLAADATAASPAVQLADEGLVSPLVRDAAYLPWLMETVRRHGVRLLVPVTDLDLLLLADHADAFAAQGCAVHVGAPEAVRACRDKAETARRVAAAGLCPVRTLDLAAFERAPFYPCFVKPVSGSAGVGAAAIEAPEALAAHVARFGRDLIVQDALEGREYTIDVYRTRDGQVRCVVPRQRLAVRSGEVEKGVTVADADLIDATVRLMGAFEGLWGVSCCQCRRGDDGRVRFFEINPRFGGGAPLSIAAGADLPLYLLQEVLGLPVTATLNAFTDRLLMLRYDSAVFTRVDRLDTLPGYDRPSFR